MKKLILLRDYMTKDMTMGRLFNPEDSFHIFTLELPWLNNKVRESCIPADTYRCEMDYYHRGGYKAYQVDNVPNRTEIKIHVGNFTKDILGCIALGKTRDIKAPMVGNSRSAYTKFMKYMDNADGFVLQIIELPKGD